MKIDVQKALSFLLLKKYISEFEVIDRKSMHTKGLNFAEWLYQNMLVTKENLEIYYSKLDYSED